MNISIPWTEQDKKAVRKARGKAAEAVQNAQLASLLSVEAGTRNDLRGIPYSDDPRLLTPQQEAGFLPGTRPMRQEAYDCKTAAMDGYRKACAEANNRGTHPSRNAP